MEASGVEGRLLWADTTGDKHNSSKSGVSIISMGSENVVSSVRVASGELARGRFPATPPEERVSGRRGAPLACGMGTAVVVSMLVMGRDSRRWRARGTPRGAAEEDEDEG